MNTSPQLLPDDEMLELARQELGGEAQFKGYMAAITEATSKGVAERLQLPPELNQRIAQLEKDHDCIYVDARCRKWLNARGQSHVFLEDPALNIDGHFYVVWANTTGKTGDDLYSDRQFQLLLASVLCEHVRESNEEHEREMAELGDE